jgi:hypothetical protein
MDTDQFYTHEGLDYPDSPYDPNWRRFCTADALARTDATIERQRALIRLWGWMTTTPEGFPPSWGR